MKVWLKSALAAAALLTASAGSASAATVVGACSPADISPDAVACSGWYQGNLLNAANIQAQKDALALIGFTWDGVWSAVDATKINPVNGVYDFAALLNGDTWIGVHKGKGGQGGFEGTAFFRLTADNLDTFTLDLKGGSSAVLYFTGGGAVPEPSTWALLIAGFGLAGAALRRQRTTTAAAIA
jgi:hypothetical protein